MLRGLRNFTWLPVSMRADNDLICLGGLLKNKFSTLLDKLCEGNTVSKSPKTYLWHFCTSIYCTKITVMSWNWLMYHPAPAVTKHTKCYLPQNIKCSHYRLNAMLSEALARTPSKVGARVWRLFEWVWIQQRCFAVRLQKCFMDYKTSLDFSSFWVNLLLLICWFYFTLGDVYKMSENGRKNDPLPKVTVKQVLTFLNAVISD